MITFENKIKIVYSFDRFNEKDIKDITEAFRVACRHTDVHVCLTPTEMAITGPIVYVAEAHRKLSCHFEAKNNTPQTKL